MDMSEYAKQCADDQGITPIVDYLTAQGLPAEAEETGGWIMNAVVHGDDGLTYLGITPSDEEEAGHGCLVYEYDYYGDYEERADGATLEEVAAIVRTFIAEHGAA